MTDYIVQIIFLAGFCGLIGVGLQVRQSIKDIQRSIELSDEMLVEWFAAYLEALRKAFEDRK